MNLQEAFDNVIDAAAKWQAELDEYVAPDASDEDREAYEKESEDIGLAITALEGAVVIPKAYEEVRVEHPASGTGPRLYCGSGPEACTARPDENPNWLWNHAANAAALAQFIEAQVSDTRQTGASQ